MPEVFISPSLQTWNKYNGGGTEAQYMGYVADALEPYLIANGINYVRSRLPDTLGEVIKRSNEGNYGLHLALHSNASPEGREGQFRGVQAYYYAHSAKGKLAAEDMVKSFKRIYPDPDLVYAVPTQTVGEVTKTKAPAVLMEIGYHDNASDAQWIRNNIQNIASALARGLTEYFSLPFSEICTRSGEKVSGTTEINSYVRVCTADSSPLNIRSGESINSPLVGQIPFGEKALLLENGGEWAKVRYNSAQGYANRRYLCTCLKGNTGTKGKVTTDGSNLNLRSEPSLGGNIIGRIPDGATVDIISSSGKWLRVRYMGATGYVQGDFVNTD